MQARACRPETFWRPRRDGLESYGLATSPALGGKSLPQDDEVSRIPDVSLGNCTDFHNGRLERLRPPQVAIPETQADQPLNVRGTGCL
jgi:hypothetical protein